MFIHAVVVLGNKKLPGVEFDYLHGHYQEKHGDLVCCAPNSKMKRITRKITSAFQD